MKILKKINYLLLIFIMLTVSLIIPFNSSKVQAKTLKQFKDELASMQQKYNENEAKKKLTQEEIASVKAQIKSINEQIDALYKSIDELKADIESRQVEIEKMNEEIKQIVHFYQMDSSEAFYLEYAFNAADFTDFIYRLAITEQLSEYREKTINKYNELIEENKKKVNEMTTKTEELKKLQSELSKQYKKIESELVGITTAGVNIKDEITDLQKTVNLYTNTYKCSDNEEISACITRYNNEHNINIPAGYTVPSAFGFYVPINSWDAIYPFRHHDNGLDLSTAEGKAVHPIADGVVIDIWEKYSCGGNMVWIAHNVNGKRYTSAYFHLKSINIVLNQQVTHNTVIGYSGGIRKGVSYNYYDACTTGPHLHLQVATGNYERVVYRLGGFHINYSAWNSNSIDPKSIINF